MLQPSRSPAPALSGTDVHELIATIQALALAPNLDSIQSIVTSAARRLTRADGATFALREGEWCHYVDEDATAPLWKGRRFQLEACVSGWVIRHNEPAAIEDVYADQRVPHDAYRSTFVRSMAMLPIRSEDPLGAIGVYWATAHAPSLREIQLLSSLAASAALAIETVIAAPQQVVLCAWTKQVNLDGRWVSIEAFLKLRGIAVSHGISEDGLRMLKDIEHH